MAQKMVEEENLKLLQSSFEALPPTRVLRPQATASSASDEKSEPRMEQTDALNNKNEIHPIMEGYRIQDSLLAWEKLQALSAEIVTSCIAKQAALLSDQLQQEDTADEQPERRQKKRRKIHPDNTGESSSSSSTGTATSELSSSITSTDDDDEEEAHHLKQVSGVSDKINLKIDRMARMSKFALEMQYYQRCFYAEMMEWSKEQEAQPN